MLRYVILHLLQRDAGNGNQGYGGKHDGAVLHSPVPDRRIFHGTRPKMNQWTCSKIEDQAYQQLGMGHREQRQTKDIVGFTKTLLVGISQKRFNNSQQEQDEDEITQQGMGVKQGSMHGGQFKPEI